jgi:hypothetical protein
MTDTGPLFVSSGDLVSDRRYKAAVELAARGDFAAAADVLMQTAVQAAPGFATAWFALGAGSAIATAPWRRFGRRATPTRRIITAHGCSWRGSAPARGRRP